MGPPRGGCGPQRFIHLARRGRWNPAPSARTPGYRTRCLASQRATMLSRPLRARRNPRPPFASTLSGTAHGTHLRDPQGTRCSRAGTACPRRSRASAKRSPSRSKKGGPNPDSNPSLRARHPERARREHAEGQGRERHQEGVGPWTRRATRRSCTRATARTASRSWSRPRRTTSCAPVANIRHHFTQGRREPGEREQRRVPVQAHGRVPAEPGRTRSRRRSSWT